jgi:hypothetical protein
MAKLTPAQVYALARAHGGLDAPAAVLATAIAMGESGLNPDAVGDVGIQTGDWGPSIGLWQVRSLKSQSGTGKSRDATRLKDPIFNAKAMGEISGGGKNWRPWSVYTNGTYKKFLPAVTTSVDGMGLPSSGNVVTDTVDAVTGAAGDAASSLNPFGNWSKDALGIGLKLVITGGALALVVAGVRGTVQSN